MEPVTAFVIAATGVLTAAGTFLVNRATARREKAESTVRLEEVVDRRMATVLDRQDATIRVLESEVEELRGVKQELQRVAESLERLCSRLIRAVRPHDPDTALEVEAELAKLTRNGTKR